MAAAELGLELVGDLLDAGQPEAAARAAQPAARFRLVLGHEQPGQGSRR